MFWIHNFKRRVSQIRLLFSSERPYAWFSWGSSSKKPQEKICTRPPKSKFPREKVNDQSCDAPPSKTPFQMACEEKPEPGVCITEAELQERQKRKTVPDLSCYGDDVFKTCGIDSYVVLKDRTPEVIPERSDEECKIRRMQADPALKDEIEDPMPPFQSVGQRLIDLNERKLHPLYKKYRTMPPKKPLVPSKQTYTSYSGPTDAKDLPKQLKINQELLENKNIYSDFKRVDPPAYFISKLKEMEINKRPTMAERVKRQRIAEAALKKKIKNPKIETTCEHNLKKVDC